MKYKNYSTAIKHIDKVKSLEDINFDNYTKEEQKNILYALIDNYNSYVANQILNNTSKLFGLSLDDITKWNSPLSHATITDYWSLQRENFWEDFYRQTKNINDPLQKEIYDRNSYLSDITCEFYYAKQNANKDNLKSFSEFLSNMSSLETEKYGTVIPFSLHKNDRERMERLYNHIKADDLTEFENKYLDYLMTTDEKVDFLKSKEDVVKFIELSVENTHKFNENFKESPLLENFEKDVLGNNTLKSYNNILATFNNMNRSNYVGISFNLDKDIVKQMIDNIKEHTYARVSLENIKTYVELSKDNKEELTKDVSDYIKSLIKDEHAHIMSSDCFNNYYISKEFVDFFDLKDTIKEMLIDKPYSFTDREMKILVSNEIERRCPLSVSDFSKEDFIKAHNNLLKCENYANVDGNRGNKFYTDIFFSEMLRKNSELCTDDNFIKNIITNVREYSGDEDRNNNYAYHTLQKIARINNDKLPSDKAYTNPNKCDFTFNDKFIGEFLEKQKEISDKAMSQYSTKATMPLLDTMFSKDVIKENIDKILSIYSLESIVYSKFLTTEEKIGAFKYNKDNINLDLVDRLHNAIYRVKDKELDNILQKKQDEDYSNLDRETYRKNVKNGEYEVTDDKLKAYANSDFKYLYDEYIANTTNLSNEFIKNYLLSMVDENIYCNLVLNAYKNTTRPKEKVNEGVKENKETDTLDVIDIPNDKNSKTKVNQFGKV